jgi:hypothetical protein
LAEVLEDSAGLTVVWRLVVVVVGLFLGSTGALLGRTPRDVDTLLDASVTPPDDDDETDFSEPRVAMVSGAASGLGDDDVVILAAAGDDIALLGLTSFRDDNVAVATGDVVTGVAGRRPPSFNDRTRELDMT